MVLKHSFSSRYMQPKKTAITRIMPNMINPMTKVLSLLIISPSKTNKNVPITLHNSVKWSI